MNYLPVPDSFNENEYSFANDPILKIYDSLSVIKRSLELIESEGLHEFEPVIMVQLRLLFLEQNESHERGKKQREKFSLLSLLNDFHITLDNNTLRFEEAKMFPKIALIYRDYDDMKNQSPYFYASSKCIVERNVYTYKEFIAQPLLKISDANGELKEKDIKHCIEVLVDKGQGAHYQHYLKKVHVDLIMRRNIISQTIGLAVIFSLYEPIRDYLINNHMESYLDRSKGSSFSVFRLTPKWNPEN
ncbi:hypothetical protein [Macrococcus equipercicus]|uniref:Uncharacterized protein n=1 Tax=Macrococcus equipercicus TaxID=69967 RepID=A0A9Q9BR67_9STAP|nr:hypothetical protein [Macrococcus equipercicus]UTH14059.1 hypothetical protein KFV11_01420 [Macrococcus equipercicus]